MKGKWCPILTAGHVPRRELAEDDTAKEVIMGMVGCLKELCEWYEHGCPAHPRKGDSNGEENETSK